ncbi:MAG: signal recognition particle protein [Gammaproteobacteria bacterium]|nr:signal recognition particle protein [Gammaproteobacteria bacterium]MYF09638.1 signal recognition particle protein [Gammaproteobacteria bacterium]MYG12242.1 signal recognition particle protein [Gammaproteobacteria bacterium]MYH14076.1 signal recognition particle protein [Gammaproteobacteria bacterium]MYK27399.1 signal recognition particle protein [Gammaproteobacteria bacterium]
MFEKLSDRLSGALKGLSGKARLTEDNVAGALREVRAALLEADVALSVVRSFTDNVRRRALGQSVAAALDPGEALVKIVHEELVEVMGQANDALNLATVPPAVILMAGLQGAGKTTTAAKLALFVKERLKKRAALVSADVYRPAAIEQLEALASQVGAQFVASSASETPIAIVERALAEAQSKVADVLIVDTAGRLAVDAAMMDEIAALQKRLNPIETLFVVDAMTGQDAAATAKAFNDALDLTGVILAKADGDARGGAALSVRFLTGKPIKFLGMGEKPEALEPFHPDRLASRILGMGDVLSLIEEAERKVDQRKAARLAKKVTRRQKFDLADFRDQLESMASMGGVGSMLDKLPGMNQVPASARAQLDDGQFRRMAVIIDSMTPHERRFPDVVNSSRKQRIARGSGTTVIDVNRMLKQHRQMQKMMKKFGRKGGMQNMMRGLQGIKGTGRPPGLRR